MYDCDLKANILIFYLYLASIHKTWFHLDLHLNTFSVHKYFVLSENKVLFNWTFCQLLHLKPKYTKVFKTLQLILASTFDIRVQQ